MQTAFDLLFGAVRGHERDGCAAILVVGARYDVAIAVEPVDKPELRRLDRHGQLLQFARHPCLDDRLQRIDALTGNRRYGDRRRLGVSTVGKQPRPVAFVEPVDLVPDFDDPLAVAGIDAEIGQDALDILGLRGGVGIGDIAQMDDEIDR